MIQDIATGKTEPLKKSSSSAPWNSWSSLAQGFFF
jgi:hypothetical protein